MTQRKNGSQWVGWNQISIVLGIGSILMATHADAFVGVGVTPNPTGIRTMERTRSAPIFVLGSPTKKTTTLFKSSIPSFTQHDFSFSPSTTTTTPTTTTTLQMASTSSTTNNNDGNNNSSSKVQLGDIAKYIVATAIQFGILKGALYGLDQLVTLVGVVVARRAAAASTMTTTTTTLLPLPLVALLFVGLSLRSRVASVLDNSRPNRKQQKGKATPSSVKRPSWTPPGIAFPFIWLSITALRGISSALIYQQTQSLHCTPLLAMIAHLSIGDTWNCITNIEQRLGVSAVGVLLVWASVWNVIWKYSQILPLAGQILSPSGIWISIATVLTWNIWLLNDKQPLYPTKGNGTSSKWKWSNLGQIQATSIGGSSSSSSSSSTATEKEDK